MKDLNYRNFVAKYNDKMPLSFYNGAIEAWNYQQQKIDELQKRIDDVENHVSINFDGERDDDQHSYWSGYNQALREIFEILKGNQS